MDVVEIKPTKCRTASVVTRAFRELVESKACQDGDPCLRDECEPCAELNRLVELLGEECEKLGCTMRRCIHDD